MGMSAPQPDPAVLAAQEKARLLDEVKKAGIDLETRHMLVVVKAKNASYYKEVRKTVENLQKLEVMMNREEQEAEGKMTLLATKREELARTTQEATTVCETLRTQMESSEKVDINRDNVLVYVKPANQVHDFWLKAESKRRSIEACLMLIKKQYEDKFIKLEMFLDLSRKLATKEFVEIYKKAKFEGLVKRQMRAK